MTQRIMTAVAAVCGLFSLGAIADKPTITVMAAISLKETMTEVAHDFEASHDAKVDLVFGASGQLASQVKAGAPADVFVSAAQKQVDDLASSKLVDGTSRKVVAQNALVLIVPANSKSTITRFEDLSNAELKHIAIGEPKSVPAGMYAMQTLKALKLDTTVADKLVMGTNVRQVLDYVSRGEADAGLVYATDAASAPKDVRVVAVADPATHEPIDYPAVVITASKEPKLAAEFVETLSGEAAKKSLVAHGFSVPATQPTK